jgi:hypothetical protein
MSRRPTGIWAAEPNRFIARLGKLAIASQDGDLDRVPGPVDHGSPRPHHPLRDLLRGSRVGVQGAAHDQVLWVPKTCTTWADALRNVVGSVPRTVPGGQAWSGLACDDLRLAGLKLIFLVVTRAVSVLGLSRRETWWKDAEILMLRHQLAVACVSGRGLIRD